MAELISAGDFATDGERQAAVVLRDLPANWVVICNKLLVTDNARSFETDFIVVGERTVFLLDEKSWRGKIYGSDQLWVRADGSSERSPLGKVDYVARVLAGLLRAKVPYLGDVSTHFVHGGILLSLAESAPQIRDSRAADGIFLPSDVCARLVALDARGGDPVVGRVRERIKTYLVDLSNRPKVPRKIDLYTIEDVTPGRPGCRVFRATLEGVGPHTLMVYDLKEDPTDPDALRDFYLREFTAVQQLRDTGLVPEMRGPFTWSEDYLVLPIAPVPGKALGAYPAPSPSSRDEFVREMRLAITAFKALALIHSRGIVHRALGPDAAHVSMHGETPHVMFSNFHAARRAGSGTIASRLNALAIDDPYAAPELAAGYGFAETESDTYSLALVFLERLSSLPASALRTGDGSRVAVPDLAERWPFLPQQAQDELTDLFRTSLSLGLAAPSDDPASRRLSAEEIAERLEGVLRLLRDDIAVGDLLDKRYRVVRRLGRGAMAQTYLVEDMEFGGEFAVKKFYRPTTVLQQAKNEFDALRHLASRFLPRIYDVYPPGHDVHVKMDYIPGPTLEEVRPEFPWPVERWWTFAQDLLEGVAKLEERGLLHRDIKPANIILHEADGRPILIDFGFAVRQGIVDAAAGTPLYLPPEALAAEQPPVSSDRYAAAVVLFQALIGRLPFAVVDGRADHSERTTVNTDDETVRRLVAVLSRGTAIAPDERPGTVGELREQLRAALIEIVDRGHKGSDDLPDLVNPWVDEIRRLYRNSDVGNADNRGLDSDFARDTYIPTALDTALLPRIFELRPKAVFLSGNPGDGKTAFLEQVRAEVQRRSGAGEVDASGWELSLAGHVFRSCYDASEAHEGQSADAQLMGRLAGLEGNNPPQAALTVLVAINDGRLADFFAKHRTDYGWLAGQIDGARRATRPDARQVWVVDLKRRAFVTLPTKESREPNGSVFQNVLARLVDPAKWDYCCGCAAQDVCPILANARTLHRVSDDAVVDARARLEYLLLLSHLRRQRHTTMRDLRSALSYVITGNASCAQVHATRHGERGSMAPLVDLSYWRLALAPLDTADDLLADLRALDPARFPQPRLDRYLHFHRSATATDERARLFVDRRDIAPQHYADEGAWLAALKRRLYFESAGDGATPASPWTSLLPYRYAADFLDLLAGQGDYSRIRECLARGISQSDGVPHALFDGFLSIKVDASIEQQLVVLKQFPLDQFTVGVDAKHGADIVETIPETITVAHVSNSPRLEVTLDLFELLMRLADGLQPDAPEYGPLLEDLVPFKSDLLRQETRDLVLLENGRRVHHLTQQDGKIVRRMVDTTRAGVKKS
jgi:serine/threonine protein kinase